MCQRPAACQGTTGPFTLCPWGLCHSAWHTGGHWVCATGSQCPPHREDDVGWNSCSHSCPLPCACKQTALARTIPSGWKNKQRGDTRLLPTPRVGGTGCGTGHSHHANTTMQPGSWVLCSLHHPCALSPRPGYGTTSPGGFGRSFPLVLTLVGDLSPSPSTAERGHSEWGPILQRQAGGMLLGMWLWLAGGGGPTCGHPALPGAMLSPCFSLFSLQKELSLPRRGRA